MVLSETKRKLKDRYVVESTTNYDMFKHLNGNREETQRRKRSFVKITRRKEGKVSSALQSTMSDKSRPLSSSTRKTRLLTGREGWRHSRSSGFLFIT